LGQLLLALEQLVQLLLVEVLELLREATAVVHPLAHRVFEGPGDVQQSPSALVPSSQVQGTVQLSVPAAAGGFAARAGPLDQGAAQEGLLGDQVDQAGTGVAFGGGAMGAVVHGFPLLL
jgi:hypothetical protein